jgi:hypothetical protein
MTRRTAYELNLMNAQRPRSVLDPITVHKASSAELGYLEIFDFFNYPRLNAITGSSINGIDHSDMHGQTTPIRGRPPEFKATPAFVVPNPESDWLVFKAPYE